MASGPTGWTCPPNWLEVWCDGSYFFDDYEARAGGAYLIGPCPIQAIAKPVQVRFEGYIKGSQDAEVATMAAALRDAIQVAGDRNVCLHVDVQPIEPILNRNPGRHRSVWMKELRLLLMEHRVEVMDDGAKFWQHLLCHRFSRIASGVCGLKHPEYAPKLIKTYVAAEEST